MAPETAPPAPQIAVFGRIPRPGAGKTRLARGVGVERAAALSRAFLGDTIRRMRLAAPGGTWFHVAPEPDLGPAETLALAEEMFPDGVRIALQEGDHLGARMNHALAALTTLGPSVLVGADVPDLPLSFVARGIEWLAGARDGGDGAAAPRLVLGPAADGGFVLIGADRAPGAMLRDEDSWGTAEVCARTRRRAREERPPWRVLELDPWWDVDEAEDLDALAARLLATQARGEAHGEDWPQQTAAMLGAARRRGARRRP